MSYTVVYATGGYANAQWHACQPVDSLDAANTMRDEIVQGGRPAYVHTTGILRWLGMPDGPAPRWDYVRLCWAKGKR